MFYRIKQVTPLEDYCLKVMFTNGQVKIYDAKPLNEKLPVFRFLLSDPEYFARAKVDTGGFGIIWDDDYDLSCDELWYNGVPFHTTE